MSAYRVVEMQTTKDGKDAQLITAYEDRDKALMAYHQAFAVVCLNSHGGQEAKEYWEAIEEA